MQEFTGREYLLIDIANNNPFGYDKKTYEERIGWAQAHLHDLRGIAQDQEWKEKPLFIKAMLAYEQAKVGQPTGHMVGFDAASSGLQINSVVTGCWSGCKATGLIDQDRRADAYGDITEAQSRILGYEMAAARSHVKTAAMTKVYGSTAEPEKVYGKGTDELTAFENAMWEVVPGAMTMLEETLASWIPYAPQHRWFMPDGCEVIVKNFVRFDKEIRIDELNGTGFKYQWHENCGEKKAKKNAANITHSLDAYLLRSLVRRCNYNANVVTKAHELLTQELWKRSMGKGKAVGKGWSKFEELLMHYDRSLVVDTRILDYLTEENVKLLDDKHMMRLREACETMLEHSPFEIITVHDDFKCHPNHMNHLRRHYNHILAALADSCVLTDILHTIQGLPVPEDRAKYCNPKLAAAIKEANYAIT